MKMLETKNEVKGYRYEHGTGGKSWTRGHIKFSEGRQWTSNGWKFVITKTDLYTGKVTLASINEAKRFLTEEGYKEYLLSRFVEMAKENN